MVEFEIQDKRLIKLKTEEEDLKQRLVVRLTLMTEPDLPGVAKYAAQGYQHLHEYATDKC